LKLDPFLTVPLREVFSDDNMALAAVVFRQLPQVPKPQPYLLFFDR
jgi:hypothetical protein